jgi:hypothetical protein
MEQDYSWSTYKVGTPCCAGVGIEACFGIAVDNAVDDSASLIAR